MARVTPATARRRTRRGAAARRFVRQSLIQEVLAHASFLRPLSGHYFDRSPILDAVRLHLPIAPEGGHGTAVFGAIHVAMDPRATA